jgi:outer membrane protein OmpA-like peptidoglycan-associated protein
MRFLAALTLLLSPKLSLAQQAVDIETTRVTQHGYGDPSITFKPNVSGRLGVQISCASKSYRLDTAIRPGHDETLAFHSLPVGTHQCSGSVQLSAEDGTSGEMPLNLQIQLLPPLEINVAPEDLDLNNKTLRLKASRALERVQILVKGFRESGGVVGGVVGTVGADGKGFTPAAQGATSALSELGSIETSVTGVTEAEVQWTQTDDADEILQLVVTGWDQQNFPGQVVLSPWSYAIPHEDVIFETGSSAIDSVQVPKLQAAYTQVQSVLRKYGDVVIVQLYVAGYTDTVGSKEANKALSTSRAASIATWFKRAGFKGAVFFQGFGESALAVPTGDDTAEARNRRAIYILAASTPKVSGEIPSTLWTPIP